MKKGQYLILMIFVTVLWGCHGSGSRPGGTTQSADTVICNTYIDSAYNYFDNGEWQTSLDIAKQALELTKELNDTAYILDALSCIASDYQQLGMQDSAIIIERQVIEIDKKNDDAVSLSTDYSNLAYIYEENKQYSLAKEFINKAIEQEKRLKGAPKLSIRYGLAAEIYNSLAKDKNQEDASSLLLQALKYADMAYDLDIANNDSLHAARRLSVKGDVLIAMNRKAEAEQAYKQSISILEPIGEKHSLSITYRHLGALYISQGKNAEAIPLLEKACDVAKVEKELYALEEDYHQLYEAYKKIDEKKSNGYLKLYTETKDSVYTLESARSLSEFQARYNTDTEKENAEHKHHLLILTWVLSGLGCIIFIAFIAWLTMKLRCRNRNNRLLHEQILKLKQQLEEQEHKFLEQLNKEETVLIPEMSEKDKQFLETVNKTIFALMGNKELNAENVANELCITTQQLYRRIKSLKDVTTLSYINSVRINYAKQLLKERHDLSIVQIGQLCGYFEATHFTRSFKKETGTTPSQFRDE